MENHLKFFDPFEDVRKTGGRLPHWQQSGRSYFVTFSMADALPRSKRLRLEQERDDWLKMNPEPWEEWQESEYHERYSGAAERWLDAGYGSCFLRIPEASKIVADALRFFDKNRYIQHSWIVMPNHVHAVFTLRLDHTLENILHSWKSFTSHEILKRFPGAPNPFWQRDYFDRLIRDSRHFENCLSYVRRNPDKARLRPEQFRLYESEIADSH